MTSGGVTFKNEAWHRECFPCANCDCQLAGQKFASRGDKPYCANCFGDLFAKRCTACSKPITGTGGTRYVCGRIGKRRKNILSNDFFLPESL